MVEAVVTRRSISGAGVSDLLEAEAHIVPDRQVRIERIGLEHHGDAAVGRRHDGHVGAVDQHAARGRVLQPGDDAQQRGLAAARRADEDDELAVVDLEVDALQHVDLAEDFFTLSIFSEPKWPPLFVEKMAHFTAPEVMPRISCREKMR